MELDRFTPKESGARSIPAAGSRGRVLAALGMATALGMTACGPDNPNNNQPDGGTAGTGGSAGEGGTAGAGGSGGNPCEGLEFEGLASKKFEPGETGSFTVNFDASHPDAHFNGTRFEMISGDVVTKPSTVGLTQVIYDNYPTGYGEIGDVSGIRPVVIDSEKNYVLDENGNCVLNVVAVNGEAMADPARQPVMESPTGTFATVFKVQDGNEAMADYSLQVTNTRFALGSMSTLDGTTDYIMGNSKPVVTVNATRNHDGYITLDLAGTTDEGVSSDLVLSKLNASAPGITFEPVVGQPGKFRTTAPSDVTSLDLSVEGPNEPFTDDTTQSAVNVPEAPNAAPEFPGTPTANPNPTSSAVPVTITVPVLDSDGDDVTVSMSFTGDPLGCTYDQNSKVVTGGSGSAVFTMTPQLFNTGNVYPHIAIDDEKGGTNSDDLGIGIQ